jgi:hypothetical protein
MANYAEEYAFWYFRLNGFFLLENFVVHKSALVEQSTESDLLAIRPPHVFEEIGGTPDDWDPGLRQSLDLSRTIGIVCEVKTGRFRPDDLFPSGKLAYSLGRLGLVPLERIQAEANALAHTAIRDVGNHAQIAKVLIANDPKPSDLYMPIGLDHAIRFLYHRVEKYPADKYRDRMFFESVLFQSIIDMATLRKTIQDPSGA